MISGEIVLVTDKGEEILHAGDGAAFPRNLPDGHHFVNKSSATAFCLEIGTRATEEHVVYSDIDMVFDWKLGFTHKDGSPYPKR